MANSRVVAALQNCIVHGDSEEAAGLLSPGFEWHYAAWDDVGETPASAFEAGAEHAAEAASRGLRAFVADLDDGVGAHVLYAASEEELVAELLRVGAELESRGA